MVNKGHKGRISIGNSELRIVDGDGDMVELSFSETFARLYAEDTIGNVVGVNLNLNATWALYRRLGHMLHFQALAADERREAGQDGAGEE